MDFIRAWYQKNILEREKFICARKDTAKMFCQWSIPLPSTSFLPLLSLMPHYFTNLSKYVNVMHDEPTSPPNIKKKKSSKMQNRAPACAKSSHPRNEFQIPHPKCMENAALGVGARTGTSKTGREVIPMVARAAGIVEATWLTGLSFWCKKQAPKCRGRGNLS